MRQTLNNEPDMDPTGVPGLDFVLRGGLPAGQLYLLEGAAGAGKTTLGLQFLLEGARLGQKVMWCTLSETEAQLRATATAHGWDLSGVTIVNLTASTHGSGVPDGEYSFFSPADVELNDVSRNIADITAREKPRRIVFDPFSDIRLLAHDSLRYRRQVLQLREHFGQLGTTVLLIQERGLEQPSADPAAEGVVNGIIALYQHAPDYGRTSRRLRIHKMRAVNYREGFHDVQMRTGGLVVFPRLTASDHALPLEHDTVTSGIPRLDSMLGGGLHRGTSLLIMGPSGAGKSTLAMQFALAAAQREEITVTYLFDETARAYRARAEGLGMPLATHERDGRAAVLQIDPAEFSPGELAHEVRQAVEERHARLVVIDSLNGYIAGMPDQRNLPLHLHELLTYLAYRNIVTILTLNQHGVIIDSSSSPIEVSYLADSALLLRYFEAAGAVRRAASVVKRRTGPHEVLIREVTISQHGVHFGSPLEEFHGVLSGQPDYVGGPAELSGRGSGTDGPRR